MTSRRLSRTAAARPGIMPGPQRPQPLALAGLWLADAVLQYQPFMVTKAFGASLAASATGNTGVVAGPVNWAATLIEHHPVVLNALSATIQLLLAAGLAWNGQNAEPDGEPGQRRSRWRCLLRTARGAPVAIRPG